MINGVVVRCGAVTTRTELYFPLAILYHLHKLHSIKLFVTIGIQLRFDGSDSGPF